VETDRGSAGEDSALPSPRVSANTDIQVENRWSDSDQSIESMQSVLIKHQDVQEAEVRPSVLRALPVECSHDASAGIGAEFKESTWCPRYAAEMQSGLNQTEDAPALAEQDSMSLALPGQVAHAASIAIKAELRESTPRLSSGGMQSAHISSACKALLDGVAHRMAHCSHHNTVATLIQ
jgi:hypothetical protein